MAAYRGRRKASWNNGPKFHPESEADRTAMLSLRGIRSFRYSIREIMSHYEVNEAVTGTVVASVIAKGSRMSIQTAADYVREQEKAGALPRQVSEEICNLLSRYTTHR